jgi:hypothetical protein
VTRPTSWSKTAASPLAEIRLHGAGWQAHLEDLGRSLAGQPSSWKQRWEELTPAYENLPIG